MRLHHYKLFILAFFMSSVVFAQQSISGTVQGEDGLPLPGVNILIKGKSSGTQTDFDGKYTITTETGDVLVYSYVGFVAQEVTVSGQSEINVTLQADVSALEEVVVVGFGTQSKQTVTTNIAKIGAEQIGGITTSNFQNTLVAKAPGVQITQVNGKLEGGVKVIIRGLSSVSASQEPLYVIDGIEMNNNNTSSIGANLNPLLSLNPNDIESIEILKDAAAAAIFGAKGTNGVILITTKRGKQQKAQISVDVSTAIGEPTNKRDWLNADQYVELLTESFINRTGADQATADAWVDDRLQRFQGDQDWRNIDYDWQEEAFQDSYVQDVNVSVSGGNENTRSFISGSFSDNDGIIRGNSLKRWSMRANIDQKVNERIKLGLNANYSSTVIDRIAGDNSFVTPLQAIAQAPTSPAFLLNGDPNPDTLYANFLLQDRNSFRRTAIRRILAKVFGDIQVMESLVFRSELGYDYLNQTVDRNTGRLAPFQSTNGQSFASDDGSEIISTNNYFTYDLLSEGASSFNFVLGMNYTRFKNRANSVTGDSFPTDSFRSISSAATISAGTGTFTNWAQVSYFARATYDYKKKYLLNASLRRDSSSRFGRDERDGYFPAASVGWIVTNEDFLRDSNVLSNLKLRASWGTNGNTPIDNFGSLGLFGGTSYDGVSGIEFTQIENPNLKWEETTQTNVGIDYGFLNNRITGEIDYYIKKTDDLIFRNRLPFESGAPDTARILENIGNLENEGFEFVLNTTNIQTSDLTWKTSFNFATNKNKVTNLPGGSDLITGRNILREGEAINSFFLAEYAGVDPANGDALYYTNTENADGTLDRTTTNDFSQAQRIIAGNPNPEFIGGFSSTLNYKNVDFTFTFQGQWGASLYNNAGQFQETGFGNGLDNQDVYVYDNRWQQPGDITDVPQARLFVNNGHSPSTRYLQDADFIRLRNLTLGYTLPSGALERIGMSRVRVYLSGLNLLTITDYRGYDPESTNDDANTNTNVGNTFYSAPPAKVYTLGVNLTF